MSQAFHMPEQQDVTLIPEDHGVSSDFRLALARLLEVYKKDLHGIQEQMPLSESFHLANIRAPEHSFVDSTTVVSIDVPADFPSPRPSPRTSTQFEVRKGWTEATISPAFKMFRESTKMKPSGSLILDDSLLASMVRRSENMAKEQLSGNSRCVISPASYTRAVWDIISGCFLCWDCITVPFVIAFDPPPSVGMNVVTVITTIFWTVDMAVNFSTGFQSGKSPPYIIMDRKQIALHYLFTFFLVDIVVISLDWIFFLGESTEKSPISRLGRTVRVLKLTKTVKLVRTMRFKKYLRAIQDMITSEKVSICFGIFRVMAVLLFVNHFVACLWYLIGTIDCDCGQPGWVENKSMKSFALSYQYVSSLHWALAQFTPAPNEIFPNNFIERLFATVVLMCALVSFSAVTGTVTAGVMQMKNMSSEESRQFWQLRRYLREWEIPYKFRNRVVAYLEYAYAMQRKRVQEKDVVLLSLLSEQLQFQLRQMTLKEHLHQHPLFFRLHYWTLVFIKSLGTQVLAGGDTAMKCGDEATDMFFVIAGFIKYVQPFNIRDLDESCSSKNTPDILEYGQWFCEMVLWTPHWISLGHAISSQECELISIHGKDFCKLVHKNFELWSKMQVYATKFVAELNKLDRSYLTDLDIFADREDFLDDFFPKPSMPSMFFNKESSIVHNIRDFLPQRMLRSHHTMSSAQSGQ